MRSELCISTMSLKVHKQSYIKDLLLRFSGNTNILNDIQGDIMNSNSNMGAAAPLKMEGMQYLKPDPEDAKPVRMLTDDDYEDTGELQLPPQFVPGWLTKVPQMLWEQWSDLDDDEEINLGVMREFEDNTTQLFLDPRIESHYDLPKEWEVRKLSRNVPNTYIFSEKDLPGFKGMKQRNSDHAKEKVGTTDSTGGVEKPKRYKTFYKRAVPSKCPPHHICDSGS